MERPQLPRLNVPTLQQKVYDELKLALISGQFAPGATLTIRNLAAEFGTSPMPVREALQRLVSEHALEFVGKRKIRVPHASREAMNDLIRLRCLLEGEAAAQAAERSGAGVVAELEALNDRMRAAADAQDAREVVNANRAFHFALYRAAGSPALLRTIEPLWLQTGPYVSIAYSRYEEESTLPPKAIGKHVTIIDAIRDRDSERARAALQADISEAADAYLRHLDEHSAASAALA